MKLTNRTRMPLEAAALFLDIETSDDDVAYGGISAVGLLNADGPQLEERAIIVLGNTPFPIVIQNIQFTARPRASLHASSPLSR